MCIECNLAENYTFRNCRRLISCKFITLVHSSRFIVHLTFQHARLVPHIRHSPAVQHALPVPHARHSPAVQHARHSRPCRHNQYAQCARPRHQHGPHSRYITKARAPMGSRASFRHYRLPFCFVVCQRAQV